MNFALSERTWKIIGAVVLGLLLLGAVLFGIDRCGTWKADRAIKKDKGKITNTLANIANISDQIGNLELQKVEQKGQLNRDVEEYQNQTYGRDDAKAETNAALGNYQRALNANTNTNATAADFEKALRKLDDQ